MDNEKDLEQIMVKLPPSPHPTKMRVEEYISFLNIVQSDPIKCRLALNALNAYNKACSDAEIILESALKGLL